MSNRRDSYPPLCLGEVIRRNGEDGRAFQAGPCRTMNCPGLCSLIDAIFLFLFLLNDFFKIIVECTHARAFFLKKSVKRAHTVESTGFFYF
jgi:hypothetical protein